MSQAFEWRRLKRNSAEKSPSQSDDHGRDVKCDLSDVIHQVGYYAVYPRKTSACRSCIDCSGLYCVCVRVFLVAHSKRLIRPPLYASNAKKIIFCLVAFLIVKSLISNAYVSVSMCVCMHTCVYVGMHVFMCVCILVCMLCMFVYDVIFVGKMR